MLQRVQFLKPFAVKLKYVESSAKLKDVYTLMKAEQISLVPIIDNGGKRNVGLYKRKKIFEWFIQNPGVSIDDVDKSSFITEKLSEVKLDTSLKDAMVKLKTSSAILIKEDGIYSALITPRVIANALEAYSSRYMVFESLENSIRQLLLDKNIDLTSIDSNGLNRPIPNDVSRLEFGQYVTIFSKKWDELALTYSKKYIIELLNSAHAYRNALMHFRLDESSSGLEDAEKLINLIGENPDINYPDVSLKSQGK